MINIGIGQGDYTDDTLSHILIRFAAYESDTLTDRA